MRWSHVVTAALLALAGPACTVRNNCAAGEKATDTGCLTPCNTSLDCTRRAECVDGFCVDQVDNTGSSGNAGSSTSVALVSSSSRAVGSSSAGVASSGTGSTSSAPSSVAGTSNAAGTSSTTGAVSSSAGGTSGVSLPAGSTSTGAASSAGSSSTNTSSQVMSSSAAVASGSTGSSSAASLASSLVSSSSSVGGASSGPVAPTFVFRGITSTLANGATYTFPDVDLGTPSADRTLLITVHLATNSQTTFGGLTVGSVAATRVVAVGENIGPSGPTALYVLAAPTGAAGTVEVTLGATAVRCAISVVAAYGLSSQSPVDTGTMDQVAPGIITVQVAPGGVVLGALTMAGPTTANASWTVAPETYDLVLDEGTPTLISGVLATGYSGMVDVGVDTAGGGFNTRALVASFR